MNRRGGVVIALAVAIGLLALVGLLAVCTPGEDDQSLERVQRASGAPRAASHDECDGDYCDGDEYDQWSSDQRNHNRRNRGAFSPGPFDRSPIEMHDVCVSLDCSGRERRRDEDGPPESDSPNA